MRTGIILKFFEKYKCSGIAFLVQSSRYVSNEQSYLKTTGLYDDLLLLSSLFHFFYFIFSAPSVQTIQCKLFHLVCFPVFPSLLFCFLMFFLKPLSTVVEKLCTHICKNNMYHIYISENLEFLPNYKFYDILIPLV